LKEDVGPLEFADLIGGTTEGGGEVGEGHFLSSGFRVPGSELGWVAG
jgi:hypothetical protein